MTFIEQPIEPRLLAKREVLPNGCWYFTGAKDQGVRYGCIHFKGKLRKAHRVSAHLYLNFDIDSPLKVLHTCDNPPCFNPKHIFIGTQADNVKDMQSKGRSNHARGTSVHTAKLTEDQVREIFKLKQDKVPTDELASRFGVNKSVVVRIASRKSWKHLLL